MVASNDLSPVDVERLKRETAADLKSVYSTKDEIDFIDGFCTFAKTIAGQLKRIECLEQYLINANNRKIWVDIDKDTVINFVTEEIEETKRFINEQENMLRVEEEQGAVIVKRLDSNKLNNDN